MSDSKKSPPEWLKDFSLFGIIVAEIVSYTGGGLLLGYAAWKYLGAPKWGMAVTAVLGLAMAMAQVYRVSRLRWFKEDDSDSSSG